MSTNDDTPAIPETSATSTPEHSATDTPATGDPAPQSDTSVEPKTDPSDPVESSDAPQDAAGDTPPEEPEPPQKTEQQSQLQQDQEPPQEPKQEVVSSDDPPKSKRPYTKKDYAEHYRTIVGILLSHPDHPLNRKRPLTFPLWPKHRRWAYEDKIEDEAMVFQRAVFAQHSTSEQARFAIEKGKARGWEVADRWTTFAEHKDPEIRELYREVFPRDARKYDRWKKFMAAEGRPF